LKCTLFRYFVVVNRYLSGIAIFLSGCESCWKIIMFGEVLPGCSTRLVKRNDYGIEYRAYNFAQPLAILG